MRGLIVAVAVLVTSCATGPTPTELQAQREGREVVYLEREDFVRYKLGKLKGKLVDEVNYSLCSTCEVAQSGRTAVCRVFLVRCGGRNDVVRIFFDESGRMTTWAPED